MIARIPPLIPISAAFLLGVAAAGTRWLPPLWSLAAMGALGVAALAALAARRPGAGLALACAVALLLGWSRYEWAQTAADSDPLYGVRSTGKVTVRGTVVQPPDTRDRYTNLYVEVTQVATRTTSLIAPTLVLARVQRFADVAYGDVISLTGELREPPTGVEFSYRDYLARQGIYTLIEYPALRRVESGQGNPFFAALYGVRDKAQGIIERSLPEPQASLLAGILLGQDQGIPRDTVEAFQRTSTTHIVAISGYNISLVAGFLAMLGGTFLRRRRAGWFVLGGIVAYALFVGGGASVVRAAIMGALLVLGPMAGRQSYAPNALAVAALGMAVQSPYILWDIGFQLSAGATLGILILATPLSAAMSRWIADRVTQPAAARLLELAAADTAVTLAATLAVQPLIVYYFHGLSLVSLLVNLLILPVQPAVIGFGTLVVLGGWLHPALGQLLGWLAWLPLTWTIAIVEWWGQLPFASFDVGRVPPEALVLYYVALAGAIWAALRRTDQNTSDAKLSRRPIAVTVLAALTLVVALVWATAFTRPDARLHVWFLDAGQGDAVLVRTPGGRFALIDGGPGSQAAVEALGRQMPFYRRDVALIVLTRAVEGKAAGLVPVIERYAIAQAVAPDTSRATAAVRRVNTLLAEKGSPLARASDGLAVDLGDGVRLEIVHAGNDDDGLTVRLRYGAFSIYLDGDGASPASDETAAVMRVGNHGGARNASASLLQSLQPRFAVISTGDSRGSGPAPDTLQRLADAGVTLYRTDLHGTIEFASDGERVWVTSEK